MRAVAGAPNANCEKCGACTRTSHVLLCPTVGSEESIVTVFVVQLPVDGSSTENI